MTEDVRCVVDARNSLGEGPLWDVAEQALYWVDIEGKLLQRYWPETGAVEVWPMPDRITGVAVRERGGLIASFASGIAMVDPSKGSVDWLVRPDTDKGNRFNDCKCDRKGRFWAGSMDDAMKRHSGALFRIDPDGSAHRMLDNWGISNCPVWSLDDKTFYFADSMNSQIYKLAFDLEKGTLGEPRVYADTRADKCAPDGGTIDAEGFIWNAQWDGWRVVRYAPDGQVDRIVKLPVQKPTSCMFGGPNLATMYITSASIGLSEADKKAQPQAGGLFALDVGVRGVPETRFAG